MKTKPVFKPRKDFSAVYSIEESDSKSTTSLDLNSHDNGLSNYSTELNVRISFRTSGTSTALLTFAGNIMKPNLKLLRTAFNECLTNEKDTIIMDMNKVDFVSDTGWQLIFSEQKRLKRNNVELFLCGLQTKVDAIHSGLRHNDTLKILSTITECQREIESLGEYQKNTSLKEISPVKSKHKKNSGETVVLGSKPATKQSISNKAAKLPEEPLLFATVVKSQKESDFYNEPPKETSSAPPNYNKNEILKSDIRLEPQLEQSVPGKVGSLSENSIQDKINAIISMHGPCSLPKILLHLRSAEFESEKIGLFELIKILKAMNLLSRKQRVRFYRSC